jgi:hypothetical protein
MAEEVKELSESEKKKEDWMNSKWRPAMGWMYMAVCTFDFIIAPILWAVIQFWETQAANDAFRQWQPLTLQGAGLFHMAMGAVLGLSAWGRTQEKLGGANNGGISTPSLGSPTPSIPAAGGFGSASSFATSTPAPSTGFNSSPSFGASTFESPQSAVVTGFGGKKAPAPAFQPEL